MAASFAAGKGARGALFCFLAAAGGAAAAQGFSFDMPEPRLRFVVPDLPAMQMQPHPNAAMQPHARYLGSDDGPHTISILMPTADSGMTPRDCARSIAGGVVRRFGVDPKFVVARQTAEATFVLLFPYKVGPLVQFKAFLMSGHAGTHCIEVHISKTIASPTAESVGEALPRWFEGFRSARIEAY